MTNLYFFAILPPEPILSEIWEFKEQAKAQFNSQKSMNSPAHITMIPPFRMEAAREQSLIDFQQRYNEVFMPFELGLDGFNHFNEKVIFVDVAPNAQLTIAQSNLEAMLTAGLGLTSDRRYGFHPHATVAFKDLKASIFEGAWAHFGGMDYQRIFKVSEVCLLKHYDRKWHLV